MHLEKSVLVIPDKAKLAALYARSRQGYEQALARFMNEIQELLTNGGLNPTIKGRVKEFDSYYTKKLRLLKKAWTEKTLQQPVNDVLAIRVVCPFLGDLAIAEKLLRSRHEIEEVERKGAERSFREFGYESIHVLVKVPPSLASLCGGLERNVIEIQLRTILQEAWAEVEHELVYKAEFTPFDEPMRRKLAALNANLTLSDIMFQEILEFQKRLNAELDHRRAAFYKKIEEVSEIVPEDELEAIPDESLAEVDPSEESMREIQTPLAEGFLDSSGNFGMDGLLLSALEAHNKADFTTAVSIYSRILQTEPGVEISSVVYKHRGMAYFAQSRYREALDDFSSCLTLDSDCYKALYYRGVVKDVLQDSVGAIDDFSSALEIHPYHFYSRYRRAYMFFKMGDLAQAHADCEIALRIEPENKLAANLFKRVKDRLALADF